MTDDAVVDADHVDAVVRDENVALADQFQRGFTLAHAAFAADQHALAIDADQDAVNTVRRRQTLVQEADQIDHQPGGRHRCAENREILISRDFQQHRRTFAVMGENDRRSIPVGQLLKTLSLDFHGERVDIRLFFIADDDDPARLGMLVEARQL